jgi:hypothetical protein
MEPIERMSADTMELNAEIWAESADEVIVAFLDTIRGDGEAMGDMRYGTLCALTSIAYALCSIDKKFGRIANALDRIDWNTEKLIDHPRAANVDEMIPPTSEASVR